MHVSSDRPCWPRSTPSCVTSSQFRSKASAESKPAMVPGACAHQTHVMHHCCTSLHARDAFEHDSLHGILSKTVSDWLVWHGRGVNGLHIVLLLFAYKLRYPDQ